MPMPRFNFTSYEKSFSVKVENLEELSVAQIQEIELFVKERKGIFDFNSYSFSIQKRLNFFEFTHLLEELRFNVKCTESLKPQNDAPRISFGEYKGVFYSQLPSSYLVWLKSNYFGYEKDFLDKEISRRGL